MSTSTTNLWSLGAAGLAMVLGLAAQGHAAPSQSNEIEIRRDPDALYCTERQLGTWFYCDPPALPISACRKQHRFRLSIARRPSWLHPSKEERCLPLPTA
jgi:hypothetical protein